MTPAFSHLISQLNIYIRSGEEHTLTFKLWLPLGGQNLKWFLPPFSFLYFHMGLKNMKVIH